MPASKLHSSLYTHIYTNFRPYGRKFTGKFSYFTSVHVSNPMLALMINLIITRVRYDAGFDGCKFHLEV